MRYLVKHFLHSTQWRIKGIAETLRSASNVRSVLKKRLDVCGHLLPVVWTFSDLTPAVILVPEAARIKLTRKVSNHAC